jgi:hypothetical protein
MDNEKSHDSATVAGLVSREELFVMVWAEPMLKVAAQFGVSSSYMARVCTVMNVPRPERGYWAKLTFGQVIKKPSLPEARPGDQLWWGRGVEFKTVARTLPKPRPAASAPTPKPKKKHHGEHPLVYGAKQLFEAGRLASWSKYLKPAKRLLVDLAVSKTGLDRALSLANALFSQLEDCGHRVLIAPEHEHFRRVAVDQHEVPKKRNDYEYSELWCPGRPTVVYIGTVAIGLTFIEMSELADAKSVDGDYERVEPTLANRMRSKHSYSWPYTTHDFPTNRFCLQAYSPHRLAEWTKQWREAKGEDLKKRIPSIVKELTEAAPEIVKLIEEGERQAAIEHQKWEEEHKRWEREEAERKAAEALKKSRQQLMDFIDSWGKAKRINEFLNEVAAILPSIDDDLRPQFERRLERMKAMIGDTDALRGLRNWKAPEEWLAEEAAKTRSY